MQVSTYLFDSKEDREMAFHNIVKWYGTKIVKRVEILELNIEATKEVSVETLEIALKHRGREKVLQPA